MSDTRERDGWLLVEGAAEAPKHKVLMLPGLQGSDRVFSRLLAEPALADAGVLGIAANPPGFKGQPVPAGFDFTVSSWAKLVEDLAAAEEVDLILGHSFGANVLIEVAARGQYGGRLVLISPSLDRAAESKDLQTLDSMSRKPVLAGLMWWVTYMMMKSAFLPYFDDAALLDAVTAEAKRIPRPVGRATLVGYFDHIDEHGDLAARLATTKVPVTYLRGDKDDIGFTAAHRATLEACDLVALHEVEGARHFAMVDQPAAVAARIVAALSAD